MNMNRYTNAKLAHIHLIYDLPTEMDVLLFSCMGKDIQRVGNRIIKHSLGCIRTYRSFVLSEPRSTTNSEMDLVARISITAATIREMTGMPCLSIHVASVSCVHTCQWQQFQTPPVFL
ncbi:hypothetical protein TNCV_3356341 [Trichonephila clavipes]|nr:hypothetical protein TNCV_3356341 [Trichonephila clavipes]